jgi:hypothetical protein
VPSLSGQQTCSTGNFVTATSSLTRLVFIAADGSETELVELVDQGTGGVALGAGPCDARNLTGRGTTIVARDGSTTTFISSSAIYDTMQYANLQTAPSGTPIFRDGVRYGITSGLVMWIRDRNGNLICFQYDQYNELVQILDSLNRSISITHTSTQDTIVVNRPVQGYSNPTIYLNFGNTSTSLDPYCGCAMQTFDGLFGTYGGSSNTADLQVITSVVLPDNSQYSFLYNSYSEVSQLTVPTRGNFRYMHGPGDRTQGAVIYNAGNPYVYRRALTRDVSADGATIEQHTTYSPAYTTGTFAGISTFFTKIPLTRSARSRP